MGFLFLAYPESLDGVFLHVAQKGDCGADRNSPSLDSSNAINSQPDDTIEKQLRNQVDALGILGHELTIEENVARTTGDQLEGLFARVFSQERLFLEYFFQAYPAGIRP